MKNLQINEQKARTLYPQASVEFKAMLEDSFGKEFFSQKITDRIKTYEDACFELGINPNDLPCVNFCQECDKRAIIAQHKLYVITRALNEGWRPNWDNSSQYKHYPWFVMSPSGFAFGDTNYWCSDSYAGAGSRLCFKSSALAAYAGRQFLELYKDLMVISE